MSRRAKKLQVFTIWVICLSTLLAGCSSILQPTREDIAKANEPFLSESLAFDVSVDFMSGKVAMYFDSDVITEGAYASWDGLSTIYYLDSYFRQTCHTICGPDESCKQWKDKWVLSNTKSPVGQMEAWIDEIEAGSGTYFKEPVVPAEISPVLEVASEESYCIVLENADVDWQRIMDIHPDSMFGGERLYSCFAQCPVTLFFDAKTKELHTVYISETNETNWIEAVIHISRTSETPEVMPENPEDMSDMLYEDWNLSQGKK